jgi:hypothetical protein
VLPNSRGNSVLRRRIDCFRERANPRDADCGVNCRRPFRGFTLGGGASYHLDFVRTARYITRRVIAERTRKARSPRIECQRGRIRECQFELNDGEDDNYE